jgi:hydroxymethylpyrimidine kinase/phosphomethylpyrimidine kinase
LTDLLLPRATLITPNLPEAAALLGRPVATAAEAAAAARDLGARFGCAVLVKGGHHVRAPATDWLAVERRLYRLSAPVARHPLSLHGTGCTLSAAIAAALARGVPLPQAVATAKGYLGDAIRAGRRVGPQAAVLGAPRPRLPTRVKIEVWDAS